MRATRARRLFAVSAAAGLLMAGGAAIGAAGTASAAAPAAPTQVTDDWCWGAHDWRCSDHRFDHRFDDRFDDRFDHRFDHRFDNGAVVIIVVRQR
ncbi:hypothetical protein KBP30_12555 [Streptomyces sp. Go40/10]|uniref:hypothetical protein n=1 Tax=Streptomyces sp. Go40/10 TaxID=2825844 RepID=UPI001E3CBE00|nr:hypothetical protein [Streptomyces sp. Go40/10]UFR01965.1 hypothetical protein KBP30_12555 [Streptomyces sp. Go40/10]